jgi:putative FmdB family regulatory protein
MPKMRYRDDAAINKQEYRRYMPIYSYKCKKCGRLFDFLKIKASEKPVCPRCGSMELDKQIAAAGVIMSGSGRPSGATCCGRDERCSTPPCADSGTCKRD